MQIFESSNKNTISTTTLNYGDHWDFDVSIFLKIDRFEGAKPHSPLNGLMTHLHIDLIVFQR